jgi:hypothetical protein
MYQLKIQCATKIVDVRPNLTGTELQYLVEWDEDGVIYMTWEDEMIVIEQQRTAYWFDD